MRLEGVGFEISGNVLLQPLNLEFSEVGVTGLVGQNGSGKSTLLRILARQQRASRGTVSFAGTPLEAWGERDFARQVAYLPQHTPLAAGLEVRELVSLGRYPWHGALGRFGNADREKVDEALTLTGTERYADRLVDTLSGGERQRVWLAMLLAQDARWLLLDEPISALDAAHQVGVLKLIQRISRDKQVAVIVVIHDINLASRFCDRIVALKAGGLLGHGPAEQFMTSAKLTEIYDVSMGILPHPESGAAIAYVQE